MDLDGPSGVLRWRNVARAANESLVSRDQLEKLFDVPYGCRSDHAEGMTLVPGPSGRHSLLIVYDSPSAGRLIKENQVRADIFDLEAL
jgi:hypothetical protein